MTPFLETRIKPIVKCAMVRQLRMIAYRAAVGGGHTSRIEVPGTGTDNSRRGATGRAFLRASTWGRFLWKWGSATPTGPPHGSRFCWNTGRRHGSPMCSTASPSTTATASTSCCPGTPDPIASYPTRPEPERAGSPDAYGASSFLSLVWSLTCSRHNQVAVDVHRLLGVVALHKKELDGSLHRIPCKVGVAGGGLVLRRADTAS